MAAPSPLPRNTGVEKTIAGTVYKIELLGAKKGKAIALMMSRIVGPSLEAKDKIAKLCELLTDAQVDNLCDTFAGQTRISPEATPDAEFALKDVFDKHFSGHYGVMMLWLKECLEANYGDFLGELGVDMGSWKDILALAMKPETESSPTGQTPLSGVASLRDSGG